MYQGVVQHHQSEQATIMGFGASYVFVTLPEHGEEWFLIFNSQTYN